MDIVFESEEDYGMNNISIIIPVRDRFESLCKCLDSISIQECSFEIEVIVIDDGSFNEIPDISKDYQFNLSIIKQVPLGIAAARNRGIREAEGDLLLFVDSDCVLQKRCLSNLLQSSDHSHHYVAFQLKLIGDLNSRVGAMEHLRLSAIQNIKAKGEYIEYINTSGFAIKHSLVNETVFFPLNVVRGEDTCILERLLRKGITPRFVANAVIEHSPQYTLPKYIAKHFFIGYQAGASHILLRKTGNVVMGLNKKTLMIKKILEISSKEKISKINTFLILVAYAFECCGRKAFSLFGIKSQRSEVLSIGVDPVRELELISKVLVEIERENGIIITYLTAWSLVQSKRDSEFKMSLSKFDLVYADGMGVVLAFFLCHLRRIKKVTFNDFYESFIKELSNRGHSIAFVGGEQGVASEVAYYFQNKYPSLITTLCSSGYLNKEKEMLLKSQLLESKADIVLVAMGQPRQEQFVYSIKQQMPNTVFWCVGGLFDVIVGKAPTPNKFIRKIGLEWFYRLIKNPASLWKRYLLGLPALVFYIAEEICMNCLHIFKVRKP